MNNKTSKILLPWGNTPSITRCRFGTVTVIASIRIVTDLDDDGFGEFSYWYCDLFDDETRKYTTSVHYTKREVVAAADMALVKAGWRLLNENDPLITLL
jgi:hypothetical protein